MPPAYNKKGRKRTPKPESESESPSELDVVSAEDEEEDIPLSSFGAGKTKRKDEAISPDSTNRPARVHSVPPPSTKTGLPKAVLSNMPSFKHRPATAVPEMPIQPPFVRVPEDIKPIITEDIKPKIRTSPITDLVPPSAPVIAPAKRLQYARPRSSQTNASSRSTDSTPVPPAPFQTTIATEPDLISVTSTASPPVATNIITVAAALPKVPDLPHQELSDFLDTLHEGLGKTAGAVLYRHGIIKVSALKKLNVTRWERFHGMYLAKDPNLSNFDSFLLIDEVSAWMEKGAPL